MDVVLLIFIGLGLVVLFQTYRSEIKFLKESRDYWYKEAQRLDIILDLLDKPVEMSLWRIKLPYATFGIFVKDDIISYPIAPIGNWMIGKSFDFVKQWVNKKDGSLECLDLEPINQ